MRPVTH